VSPGKILILAGGVLLVIGLLVELGLPLGRLPGDIRYSNGNVTIYAPIATGLLLSIALTIVLNLLLRR
jgi:hypothetical protein